jgi:CheY-like chemotaxis protein
VADPADATQLVARGGDRYALVLHDVRHRADPPHQALEAELALHPTLPLIVVRPMRQSEDDAAQGWRRAIAAWVWRPAGFASLARAIAGATQRHRHALAARPRPRHSDAPLPWAGRRVLIAEDNVVNQRVAVRLVEKLGCAVEVVANGREAVDACRRSRYDLVLMDCQMPEMDGFAATAAIREAHGGGARVPIVALTANALAGDRERCLSAGMDDYLPKPVTAADIATLCERWLPAPKGRTAGTAVLR